MGIYTIDDVNKKIKATGIKLSDADMRLAQSDPDAGISLISYKTQYNSAKTDAQRNAAHEAAENIRLGFGYSGGTAGSGFYKSDTVPTYTSKYDAEMDELFDRLMNREAFSYDAEKDPLYRQYRDIYTAQGRAAMRDTMGQAAALTGGYGSSYAQNVGHQAYDAYLQKLNEAVPELYGQAYEMYIKEGNELNDRYDFLADREKEDYDRYQDKLSLYYSQQDAARKREAEEYEKLVALISETGYNPTASEMANANMSEKQKEAYLSAYQQKLMAAQSKSSGRSSGGSSGSKKKTEKKSTEEIRNTTDKDAADWIAIRGLGRIGMSELERYMENYRKKSGGTWVKRRKNDDGTYSYIYVEH